jgi:hypothetical protein
LLVVKPAPKSESSKQNGADENEDGANCYDVQSQCKVHGMDLHVDGDKVNLANRFTGTKCEKARGGQKPCSRVMRAEHDPAKRLIAGDKRSENKTPDVDEEIFGRYTRDFAVFRIATARHSSPNRRHFGREC